MKKLRGLEKENAELKEKLTEVQTEIKGKNSSEYPRKNRNSSESDEDHPRRKKSSGSSSSDEDSNGTTIKKVCAQEVLEKLREPKIEVKSTSGKIEKDWYSLEIFIQKYSQFIREVNEYNRLLIAEDFNNNERCFEGIYTYLKELYTKDLIVSMKTILENNGIHPHPFKFVYGMQQCTTQFHNKAQHIEHIENFHKKKYFKLNYEEYLFSQVFHNDFKPHKLNQERREVYDEKFWEKKSNVYMKTVIIQLMHLKEVTSEIY
jgi:hypothetical protein